jgi:hypothetical protein
LQLIAKHKGSRDGESLSNRTRPDFADIARG